MADEDEIDILGDFSFNSCLAQNNQGLLNEETLRKLSENKATKQCSEIDTIWNQGEKNLLEKEMEKCGRNVHKISQNMKTKIPAEIQMLIEAEHESNLDTPEFGIFKNEVYDDVPTVVQEEVVTDDMMTIRDTMNLVTTAQPTIPVIKRTPLNKKSYKNRPKNSLLKPNIIDAKKPALVAINPTELFYDDDLIIGSTESIGAEIDISDSVLTNLPKKHRQKIKGKNMGNQTRKVTRNNEQSNVENNSKEIIKSPQHRKRFDSGVSEDCGKSPKMIVFGSGQALLVSEGEEIIKIEKKNNSEPESDIEVDIDSDVEENKKKNITEDMSLNTLDIVKNDARTAVPLRKFEPMPKRRKKINLDGGGGCTIMHTPAGDLYEVATEPKREKPPKKEHIHLIQCRVYNSEKPAPCEVSLNVSALLAMDAHAHTSRGEVMGLLGAEVSRAPHAVAPRLLVAAYCRAAAANARTHCDMDPVSQAQAAEALRARRLAVCGWHHSHPAFPGAPSALDLRTQRALQAALERGTPFLAFITSQHWPPGRDASHYRCFHVEDDGDKYSDPPVGYSLNVKLVADLSADNVDQFLLELRSILLEDTDRNELSVEMARDVCTQAGITYLDKLISSMSHHLRSAGYDELDAVTTRVLRGVRETFS